MSIKDYEVFPDWYEGPPCPRCQVMESECKCTLQEIVKFVNERRKKREQP